MRTTDLFKNNRSSKKINESIQKTFGRKLNLENFDLHQLQDARNKLRTQVSQVRSSSGFNENLENEAFTEAQWMLDAINSEIEEREEFISSSQPATVSEEGDEDNTIELKPKYADGYFYAENSPEGVLIHVESSQVNEDQKFWIDYTYNLATGKVSNFKLSDDYNGRYEPDDQDVDDAINFAIDEIKEQYGTTWEEITQNATGGAEESMAMEKAPPGAKAERMVKHIKAGYAKDGKLTDKEKSIAYATAWKQHNKEKNESAEQGDNMAQLREGEIQQAQSIVTAKTMVDRVGRWIEELSGMENDTLLQLGDQIRDEMSADQAKMFISTVAPAIQQALEALKGSREILATGVRQLTGEEQAAQMLGAEPGVAPEAGAELPAVEPDAMNAEPEMGDEMGAAPEDEFGAADAAAGGLEAAGRMKRESIDRSNRLLKVLAG